MEKKIESLRKLINDNELFDKALEMSSKPKVKPSSIHGKVNYLYTFSHTELYTGLDLINKALKKPLNNSMRTIDDKNNSAIIKQLNNMIEEDTEDTLLVSLLILQTEKEKKINFKPIKLI